MNPSGRKDVNQEDLSPKQSVLPNQLCLHCRLPLSAGLLSQYSGQEGIDYNKKEFCCPGCEFVYHTINKLGLSDYYLASNKHPRASTSRRDYRYFDDNRFVDAHTELLTAPVRSVCFYLPGIHCSACIWLLEQLPHLNQGITQARVDFAKSHIYVCYNSSILSLSQLAALLQSLGYPPVPLRKEDIISDKLQRQTSRAFLVRIGVAGVCAANVMMLAVSLYQGEYTGIEYSYKALLSWVSLFLSLPAILFSAAPLFRTALAALRTRTMHIDLPITLALVVAFAASVSSTIQGHGEIYYDSITAVIFLLLVGRWLQYRGVQKATNYSNLLCALMPLSAKRRSGSSVEEIYSESLSPGDTVVVATGDGVPADGQVLRGESFINQAFLTGENYPVAVKPGMPIFAGTINNGPTIECKVENVGRNTRAGKIASLIEQGLLRRTPIEVFLNRCGKVFTTVVLLLSAVTFLYWVNQSLAAALSNTIALLVVSCPCVIALATPLTFSLATSRASRQGILIKGSDVIERVSQITHMFLDKTGTVTEVGLAVTDIFSYSHDDKLFHQLPIPGSAPDIDLQDNESFQMLLQAIASLEDGVTHPAATALRSFVSTYPQTAVPTVPMFIRRSIQSQGVEGKSADGTVWLIGSWASTKEKLSYVAPNLHLLVTGLLADLKSPILLIKNGQVQLLFALGNTLYPDAKKTVTALSKRGISLSLLSGDTPSVVKQVAQQLGIPEAQAYGGVLPEEKSALIQESESRNPTAMVGDGVNDAAALQAAHVGVGIHGGAEACLRVADVYLAKSGIAALLELIEGSRRTMTIVRRNLAFSAIYNIIGGTLAMLGYIGPLEAAILMPLSSLTVIGNAFLSRTF